MTAIGKFKIETTKSGKKLVYRIRYSKNVDIKISLNHILLDLGKWSDVHQSFKYKRNENEFKKSVEINNSLIQFSLHIHAQVYSPDSKKLKLTSKWLREKYYDFFGFENPNQSSEKIDNDSYFI